METALQLMMRLMRSAILQTENAELPESKISDERAAEVYALAKKHDVLQIVAQAWSADFPKASAFEKSTFVAVYRYETMKHEMTQLCAELEKEKIPFIPLKGAVIRDYYPEPWWRTSCDIDILVKPSDLDRAQTCLIEHLQYKHEHKGKHDVSLFSPANVHVELHYDLIEDDVTGKMDLPLKRVWEYACAREGFTYQQVLREDMYYYYHVAHMAKHFLQGGCGIRPFLDLWILNRRRADALESARALLEEGSLAVFAEQARDLSEVWFEEHTHTPITEQMQNYVIYGGVYGNLDNRVTMGQTREGGKFKYALKRIWLPYDTLKFHYPSLEKRKWLFPLYQVRRWMKLLFCGGFRRSVRELRINGGTSADAAQKTVEMLNLLDLH